MQASGVDYSINGSAVTFLPASVPLPGDLIQAYYRIAGTASAVPNFSDGENPNGSSDGTNVTFMLANSPNPTKSLKLYKNGMLLQQTNDYTVNAKTITFVNAATPQPGDSVTAYYRY